MSPELSTWLYTQGVSTVLLVLIGFSMAWMIRWSVKVGVPAHIAKIQEGYERNGKVFADALIKQNEQNRIALGTFKEISERQEKAHTDALILLTASYERIVASHSDARKEFMAYIGRTKD